MTYCNECAGPITAAEIEYSENKYNNCLCNACQKGITVPEKILFEELRERDYTAILHKNDEHKTIDLTLPDYQINIEIDGHQHNFDLNQKRADYWREFFSEQKSWPTIRVPNECIEEDIFATIDEIEAIIQKITKVRNDTAEAFEEEDCSEEETFSN